MMMTVMTTTTPTTPTLFTISMMILMMIVGMMNAVVVLGADDVQAESNLCYAVRLDKECNAVTDQTSCLASDKQCFW